MRKVLAYILILASVLYSGCSQESLHPAEDADGIVLYFSTGSNGLDTKATTPGVANYNENVITSVDCFFYPEGEGKTVEDAVLSAVGRPVERVSEGLYKTTVRYSPEQALALFHSETDGTCKVFVLANASFSYGSTGTSIPDLKQKVLERDFSAQMLQGSFVMYSDDGGSEVDEEGWTLTLSSGNVTGTVPMLRVAAKAQVFVKVVDQIIGENAAEIWKPDLANMKVCMVNGMKRTRVNAPYVIATDGTDYFDYADRPLYDFSDAGADADAAATFAQTSAAGFDEYIYSSKPFYSYPLSWKDIHDHSTQFIITVPWYIDAEGSADPKPRYYQVSANTVEAWFLRNHYYRTFVEINTLGGEDKTTTETITNCSFVITPWFKASSSADSGVPVVGEFESQSYLVVQPEAVILNNESVAEFDYLSSSALSADSTRVIKVSYYNYQNSIDPIIRTEHAASSTGRTIISSDNNTNSTAIQVDISQSGKVKVTHNLYDNQGKQKIYVAYDMVLRIYNADGLYEDVTISQRPPLYVLMKPGDNAFIDGYFRHVQKTGGGAPFDNAYPFPSSDGDWYGYYRSVSFYINAASTNKDEYWYLGTGTSSNNDYRGSRYTVNTPYGNMASSPGSTDLNLINITGLKLSAFSESHHSYTVNVGTNGSGATSQTFEYRIGDPRINNNFTGNPKLEDYLTGMGSTYTNYNANNYRRYNSNNVSTQAWGSLADKVMIGQTDHEENTLIAPYILISSVYTSQWSNYGITYETAKKRCATYQEGGYPAGRWRLPTEAEIMFIVERQGDDTINILFNTTATNSYYWAASGYYFNGGNLYANTDSSRKGAARCVYDAWYWGDEPVAAAAYTYTPMP